MVSTYLRFGRREHLQDPPVLIKFTVSLLYVQKNDEFKVDFHGFSITDFPMFFGPDGPVPRFFASAMPRTKSLRRLVLLAPLALLRPALFALPEERLGRLGGNKDGWGMAGNFHTFPMSLNACAFNSQEIYRHIISYHDTSIIPAASNGKSNFLLIVRPCGQPHDVVFNGNYSREMCIRQSANTTDVSKT